MIRISLRVFVIASLLFVTAANAQITAEQAALIDEGFRLFNEETYDGNGRTCATCHIAEKQYNIFPSDIQEMDGEELELVTLENTVPGLENPTAVIERALFNVEGEPGHGNALDCDSEECEGVALRGSMTVGALARTSRGVPAPPFGPNANNRFGPNPALGWAMNGSPGNTDGVLFENHGFLDADADGSIRAFANGAIAQHFPKTLNRLPAHLAGSNGDPDFRLATTEELDALEAFSLWLGRQEEFNIGAMTFEDARAEQGKAIFMTNEAGCNFCHRNGGANSGQGFNIAQHTEVNHEAEDISNSIGVHIPEDPGIAFVPPGAVPGSGESGFGAFNGQSLIEAVRKEALFHNNAFVEDEEGGIEEASTFYFREPFASSPLNLRVSQTFTVPPVCGTDGSCNPRISDIEEFKAHFGEDAFDVMGAFLRSLSAFYLVRDCERLIEETIARIGFAEAGADVRTDLAVMHCRFNLNDARKVLRKAEVRDLYPSVTKQANKLRQAAHKAAKKHDLDKLDALLEDLVELRNGIATTPELP